jgi:hypothetical protein
MAEIGNKEIERSVGGGGRGGSISGDAFDAGREKAKHICGWTVKNAKLKTGGPEQQVAKRTEALACKKLYMTREPR